MKIGQGWSDGVPMADEEKRVKNGERGGEEKSNGGRNIGKERDSEKEKNHGTQKIHRKLHLAMASGVVVFSKKSRYSLLRSLTRIFRSPYKKLAHIAPSVH